MVAVGVALVIMLALGPCQIVQLSFSVAALELVVLVVRLLPPKLASYVAAVSVAGCSVGRCVGHLGRVRRPNQHLCFELLAVMCKFSGSCS